MFFIVVVLCYYFVVIDVIAWIVDVCICLFLNDNIISSVFLGVCVCVCVLRYFMCLLYLHHIVDIMDFLFMLSAYAGCPELNRFSPYILFPSINIEGHIVGVVNCTCTILHWCFELSWTSIWRCAIFFYQTVHCLFIL